MHFQAINTDLEKTQAALTELFTDRFQVAFPKVKLPVTSTHLYIELQNKEDKRKVLEGSDQPERWGNKKFSDNKKAADNPSKIIAQVNHLVSLAAQFCVIMFQIKTLANVVA